MVNSKICRNEISFRTLVSSHNPIEIRCTYESKTLRQQFPIVEALSKIDEFVEIRAVLLYSVVCYVVSVLCIPNLSSQLQFRDQRSGKVSWSTVLHGVRCNGHSSVPVR